jgi:hypothetical protein
MSLCNKCKAPIDSEFTCVDYIDDYQHHDKCCDNKGYSRCRKSNESSKHFSKTPPNVVGKWKYYEEEVQHKSRKSEDWGSIYNPIISTGEFELIQNGVFVQTKPNSKLERPPELSVWEKIRDRYGNFISWQLNTVDTNYDNDILRYNYVKTDCCNNAILLEGIKLETGFMKNNPDQTPEVAIIKIIRIL